MGNKQTGPVRTGYLSLDLLVNRLNQVATQGALIGGFAFSALTAIEDDPTQPYNHLVYYFSLLCSASVGCNILCVTIMTLMNITIPSARIHPEGKFYSILFMIRKIMK